MAAEPRTRRERITLGVLLSPTLFWLILFFLIPLVIIFVYSFLDRGTFGGIEWTFQLDNYIRFVDPLYIRIFGRSLLIAGVVTVICLVVGYPMAYWIASQPPQHRNTLMLLIMLPFFTNFVVRTYALRFILLREGVLNQALIALGLANPESPPTLLFSQEAVVLGLVYTWIVGMVLPCYASLVGLDRSLVEAAKDLYANSARAFLRVTLPLTTAGIVAGTILVFIPSFGAFVTPDLLGGSKSDMIGNLIQQQFGSANDWPFGSAISAVLLVAMLIATIFYFRTLRSQESVS
ncbi:MAG: ABC transporter permease [Anaerolineales bacterium]